MSDAIVPALGAADPVGARHLVIVCALLAAAARFIPLPLLDDIVRERIHQVLVSRLLKARGRRVSSSKLAPLWQDSSACTTGCVTLLWKLPLKLLLFPIRKLIAIFTALTGFSKEVTRTVLLGRCVDRVLAQGGFVDTSTPELLQAQARQVRNAFDLAMTQTDTSVVVATLTDVLREVRGLPRAALRGARSLTRSKSDAAEDAGNDADRQVVEQGASRVERALDHQTVQVVFTDFDARFDAALESRSDHD